MGMFNNWDFDPKEAETKRLQLIAELNENESEENDVEETKGQN